MTVKEKTNHESFARWKVPTGWEWVSIQDVGEIITGNTPLTKDESNYGGNVPFVKPPELNNKGVWSASSHLSEKGMLSARMLPIDAVLVSCIGGLGKVGLVKVPVAFNQQINAIIFNKCVIPEFGFYYAQMLKPWLYSVASATTLPIVNKSKFQNAPFPLAPLVQQQRIVAEIEKQFSRLDEAVANLQRVKANLKRYKAAVLKAAVEGKLTEEWRKDNPDIEPASKLLERILEERRSKWEEAELAKMAAKGNVPKDSKWKKAYKEPVLPKGPEVIEIPKEWIWLNPDLLSSGEKNAICAGPFGTIFKAKDFRPDGIPIVFLRHVSPGKYWTKKPGFMDEKKWNELFQSYSVYGGELLVTKLGEPPGVCAIYPEGIGPAMVTPDVMKMSVNNDYMDRRFLMHFFNSQLSRDAAASLAFGTTRLRLTLPISWAGVVRP